MIIASPSAAKNVPTPKKLKDYDIDGSFKQNEEETLNLEAELESGVEHIRGLSKFSRGGRSFQ